MAAGKSYFQASVPGEIHVFALGSAAAPSIQLADPNALGGYDDGIYGTSGPGVGVAINGVDVALFTSTGMAGAGAITSKSATAGIGYATGAGGAVTQTTSRTTGVTLNKITGAITTATTSLAAEGSAEFTVTNSAVAVGDTVVVCERSGSNSGGTIVFCSGVAAGSFNITVHNGNVAAGTAETGAIIINFAVIKAVSA